MKSTSRAQQPEEFVPYPVMAEGTSERLDAWLRATQVQPIRAMRYDCSAEWTQERRRLHNPYWYWIESGHGVCYRDDAEPLPFQAPGMMLFARDCPHAMDGDGELVVHTVHFLADVYGSIDLVGLLGLDGWVDGHDTQLGALSYGAARDFTLKAPGWRQSLTQVVWSVLLYMVRERCPPVTPEALERQAALAELRPVLDMIEAQLPEPWLAVGDLAARLEVGETTLRQRFAEILGQSPVAYLRRRRIDRACRLLASSSRTVQDIAAACGFADAPYFCRTFKQLTGHTPMAYRDLVRGV